ncbi:DNA excision repair protein ERCC-5-like [Argiope bruennichi]|uniref:DNA repair protein complementing XP-G cells like protein n=1 Tax=Argiope bruennichi TaxID=94029 RepID=A0A8T0EDR2_ARGBR|nr:DNA excision repair protein ERCC-5-like [Argiope bruennichi]KAF8771146.1 DNA repair protein complementing XP-G cells like protein [Argiope bruennichi]
MGVLGLWQLLAPVGQPVALESLENKIFAVDISIWLNQALKGYRDSQGGSVANAHLLSLFSRLCKLLFYKIRPIIVFDGGFPELKKQTIINRHQRRAAVKQTSRDIGLKILTNYLASKNLATVGGETNSKAVIRPKEKVRDEIFMLPPLPDNSLKEEEEGVDDADSLEWKFTNFSKEDIKYLNKIDLESEDFNNLPPDVKQEILSTLKESRRHRTWDQYEELPKESQEFSSYQMQCLLKKRSLSRKLEEVQKDMRKISSADFIAQYTSDHVIGETNKIMSDDISHYVLLKKIIQKNDDSVKDGNSKNSSSVMLDTKNAFIKDLENIDIDDYSVSKTDLSQNDNSKNIKTEENFESSFLNEEDVDNPPKFVESKIKSEKSDAKESKLSQQFIDDTLSSDDDELALAVQMSMEHSNDEKTYTDSSLSLSQISVNDSIEILSVKSRRIADSKEKSTVCLSSSDDELIPCEEKIEADTKNLSFDTSEKQCAEIESPLFKAVVTSNVENEIFNKKSQADVSCSVTAPKEFAKTAINAISSNSQIDSISSDVSKQISVPKFDDEMSPKHVLIQKPKKISANNQFIDSYPSTSYANLPSSSSELTEVEKAEIAQRNLQLQEDLESATALLEADKAKQDRQNRTVQEHMVEECKELLQLFGIPFIVSPTEAEAQCAFYDYQNLTHGTITDDSDVWLFGGKRVYKNFFTQQKYVEFYKDHEIFTHFGLSRKKLINFAILTGSDYTEGIDGVGPVTATEILSEFPKEGIEALYEFKEWWTKANKHALPPENKVRAKLMKLVLSENFPDERIPDAYLNPAIDDSTEKFTWGRPDLDALRDYTKERFGWSKAKVDDALLPVIKKLSERDTQTHIDNFFTVSLKKQTNLFPSKRIMSALKKLTSPQKGNNCEEENVKAPIKRKAKNSGKKTVPKKVSKATKNSKRKGKISKPQGPVLSEESSDEL